MQRATSLVIFLLLIALLAGTAMAQEFMIYPAQGQSQEQMDRDKFECYSWAKNQTGFDPMQLPQATAPSPQKEASKGGVVRGGARGAAVGVVGGAIAGDARKGAAIGAATGGLVGGMRRQDQKRQEKQAQKQWEQEQVNTYTQNRNAYNRAYSACLEGRGYTVR